METSTIIEIAAMILGGSGLTGFLVGLLTIRYERRKIKGEARSAEDEATKAVQDIYQQMIADQKQYNDEQKEYIEELKAERKHLRKERDEQRTENEELRKRQRETEEEVLQLKKGFARQGREIESMRPLFCARSGCKDRIKDMLMKPATEPKGEKPDGGRSRTAKKKEKTDGAES